MTIRTFNGQWLTAGGGVATSDDCCCDPPPCGPDGPLDCVQLCGLWYVEYNPETDYLEPKRRGLAGHPECTLTYDVVYGGGDETCFTPYQVSGAFPPAANPSISGPGPDASVSQFFGFGAVYPPTTDGFLPDCSVADLQSSWGSQTLCDCNDLYGDVCGVVFFHASWDCTSWNCAYQCCDDAAVSIFYEIPEGATCPCPEIFAPVNITLTCQ